MKHVYIVQEGSYSGRGIEGIAATLTSATRLAQDHIDERSLDTSHEHKWQFRGPDPLYDQITGVWHCEAPFYWNGDSPTSQGSPCQYDIERHIVKESK